MIAVLTLAGLIVVAICILAFWNRAEGLPWEKLKPELESLPGDVQVGVATMFGALFLWGICIGLLTGFVLALWL